MTAGADGPEGSDPLVGTRLDGQFDLLELVGRGGMGRVYRAVQHPLGRTVAVKVVARDHGPPGGLSAARFLREAKAAARVVHPNIVTIHAYGETPDGWLYLVMEHLRGRTLAEAMDVEVQMDLVRTSLIAEEVAGALAAAHARGVLHRDLKPTNVFLARVAGREDVVKLLDFGLAKAFTDDISLGSITADDVVVGTSGYLAPEQIRCEPPDPRTDVWALAVLLYRAVTGVLPFMGDKAEVIHRTLEEAPPAPSALRPGLDRTVERVILWGLNKDKDDRPASVIELARGFAMATGAPFTIAESQVGTVPSHPVVKIRPKAPAEPAAPPPPPPAPPAPPDDGPTAPDALAAPGGPSEGRAPDGDSEGSTSPVPAEAPPRPARPRLTRHAALIAAAAVASAVAAGLVTWVVMTR